MRSMALSGEQIEDFIARWKRAFGEDLPRDQAEVIGQRVLGLLRELLCTPLGQPPDVQDEGTLMTSHEPMPPADPPAAHNQREAA